MARPCVEHGDRAGVPLLLLHGLPAAEVKGEGTGEAVLAVFCSETIRWMNRYVVGPTSSIPNGGVRIVHPDRSGPGIGVFNVAGEFYALRNSCPHMDGPLCAGTITGTSTSFTRADGAPQVAWERDGEIIACPWHRWEFEIRTGRTVFPSQRRARRYPVTVEPPEAMERLRGGAETYPVTVEDGIVVLELGGVAA
jgi:nitrite reductase/ring-hydroxylating ferredoxin subunit